MHKSRDLQCKKVEYSGSPSSPRFNGSMIGTIEDPREELCLKHRRCTGKIAVTGKNGHNSLNWNAFWANEDLLERKFRAPCMESNVWRNFQSGQREKSVKRKVATKDNKEGGDHDVRDDWASFR